MSEGPFDSLLIYQKYVWDTKFWFQNTSEDGPLLNPKNFYKVEQYLVEQYLV